MVTSKSTIVLLLLVLLHFVGYGQETVPYEAKENFDFELDYTFKTRPPPDNDEVTFLKSSTPRGSQVLPYLKVKFTFSTFDQTYFRFKVSDAFGLTIRNKKLKQPDKYILDMGFSDDLKDRITSHKYTIHFYTKDKKVISKIQIEVEENGDLLLNGEFNGRI